MKNIMASRCFFKLCCSFSYYFSIKSVSADIGQVQVIDFSKRNFIYSQCENNTYQYRQEAGKHIG